MKRIVCVALILLMLIPPMAVSAEGDPSITITGAEGRAGDTVQVVVSAADLPACASMELILQYDATVLKPTAHAKGGLTGLYIGNLNYGIKESDGIGKVGESAIKIVGATSSTSTPLLSGDLTLVTLTFELLADPGPEGAKVELLKYLLSQNDANLTKVTSIPLPTGYVTREQAVTCAVTAPGKTTYYTGDALDLEGGSIWVAYADNDQETVLLSDLPEGAITGYDPQELGPQEISVTYAGQTGTFNIELLELMATALEVTTQPTRTEYVLGQPFDLSGGELTLSYNSGKKETIPLTNDLIDDSADHEIQEGWCMIPVTYGGRYTHVNIHYIARVATGLTVLADPAKLVYVEGQALDLTGGVLLATFNDNSTEEIPMTDPLVEVAGFDNATIGLQELTIGCKGQETTLQVTVIEKVIESIAVKTNPKTEYVEGQPFDLSGGVLTATYNDGDTVDVPFSDIGVTASGYDPAALGERTITVSYADKTAQFTVTVIEKAVESVQLLSAPDKTVYIQGQVLDLTGGVLLATFNDNSTEEIPMTDPLVEVAGFDNATIGLQELTIGCKGQETTLQVTVIEKVIESIAVKTNPKTEYVEGQPFDLSGGVLTATYNDGDTVDVPFSDIGVTASGYDPAALGERTITVSYADKTAQFTVTVIEKAVESVQLLSAPDKTVYIQGEALDLTGGKIRIHYNNDDQKEQDITATLVSGYQPDLAGVQTLAVTVEGKQAQFQVTVLSPDQAPTVCVAGGEGVVGQTINVTLSTLRAPVSGGFQLEFSYDPSLLQPIAWTDGLADNAVPNNDALGAVPGVLRLAGLYMEPFSGTQTLGTVTFRLLAPGTAEVTLVDGFLTSETFGSDPIVEMTVLGKTDPIRIKAKAVERIALTAPEKRIYWMGEGLDLAGSSATVYYNDGTHQAIAPASMTVTGFNNRVGGEQTVTLSYGGKSASFKVIVLKKHPFTDVSNDIWYYTNQSVPYVYTLGLMNGMTATTFGGEGETTRAQLVTILYRLEGQPSVSGDDGFSDVASADWYYKAVLWASKSGIVTGYPDGTFAPNKSISRAEMAVIFYRYTKDYKKQPTNARADLSTFADRAEIGAWSADAISWAVAEGLMTGMPGNLFAPAGTATRAQIATVLMRYVEKNRV